MASFDSSVIGIALFTRTKCFLIPFVSIFGFFFGAAENIYLGLL